MPLKKKPDHIKLAAITAVKSGSRLCDVAKKFNISVNTISFWLLKAGLRQPGLQYGAPLRQPEIEVIPIRSVEPGKFRNNMTHYDASLAVVRMLKRR
jgi:transposase-like protein